MRGRGTGAVLFGRAGTPSLSYLQIFGDGLKTRGFSRTLGSVVKNAETSLTKLS